MPHFRPHLHNMAQQYGQLISIASILSQISMDEHFFHVRTVYPTMHAQNLWYAWLVWAFSKWAFLKGSFPKVTQKRFFTWKVGFIQQDKGWLVNRYGLDSPNPRRTYRTTTVHCGCPGFECTSPQMTIGHDLLYDFPRGNPHMGFPKWRILSATLLLFPWHFNLSAPGHLQTVPPFTRQPMVLKRSLQCDIFCPLKC